MYVRFWGTRGSIATPGPQTSLYGGNTACVEVRTADGTHIILDCGTGARALGAHLSRAEARPLRLHLLIGHTHWDHIQGFPFFRPAFLPDSELYLYAPRDFHHSLKEALSGQMQYPYFPVKLRELSSCMHYRELEEGCCWVGNVRIDTQYLNHTAPTLAYRLSSGGTSIAYVTDHEPFWQPSDDAFHHPGDRRHIEFLQGADLIIHDAQYTQEEYHGKVGWGHSPVEYATDVALAAGAARLALFHHDPGHDDKMMQGIEEAMRHRVAVRGGGLEIFAASEGLEWQIPERALAPTGVATSALSHRSMAGARVMIVSADELQAASMARALGEDHLILTRVPDRETALAAAPAITPDLVIINQRLLEGAGPSFMQSLRIRLNRTDLPVVLLTASADDEVPISTELAGATDYLADPVCLPMLRTRVRVWLERTLTRPPGQDRRQRRCARHAQS